MTMTITFTGNAAEVRREMEILLGRASVQEPTPVSEQTVDQQVEQAFGETKKPRGRPKKAEAPVVVEEAPVVVEEAPVVVEEAPVVITYTPEDQAAAKAALEVLKEVVKPEVEEGTSFVAPEPEVVEPEQTDDTPANAQDLMTACMAKVAGDSAKKIALVKLLQSFDAKTVNGLAAENYKAFWVKVKGL